MNSLACVCITDFIKPAYRNLKGTDINENTASKVTKLIALAFGILAILLAYFCQYFPTAILQVALSIFGILGGPILGVISLGFNKKILLSKVNIII
jgi:Na+/proline symporter